MSEEYVRDLAPIFYSQGPFGRPETPRTDGIAEASRMESSLGPAAYIFLSESLP